MDLLNILACPECHSSLEVEQEKDRRVLLCRSCKARYEDDHGIILMMSYETTQDPAYKSDVDRYNEIARTGMHFYRGLQDTRPYSRSLFVRDLLIERNMHEFVNIGPGFGYLEELTWGFDRVAVDEAVELLKYIRAGVPEVHCINAIAERLPFRDGSVPCIVADSVFQSVIDRRKFLNELARVLKPRGFLILSVAYGWNYPRKPQDGFNVLIPQEKEALLATLGSIGFKPDYYSHMDTWTMQTGMNPQDANYLWIVATRR